MHTAWAYGGILHWGSRLSNGCSLCYIDIKVSINYHYLQCSPKSSGRKLGQPSWVKKRGFKADPGKPHYACYGVSYPSSWGQACLNVLPMNRVKILGFLVEMQKDFGCDFGISLAAHLWFTQKEANCPMVSCLEGGSCLVRKQCSQQLPASPTKSPAVVCSSVLSVLTAELATDTEPDDPGQILWILPASKKGDTGLVVLSTH